MVRHCETYQIKKSYFLGICLREKIIFFHFQNCLQWQDIFRTWRKAFLTIFRKTPLSKNFWSPSLIIRMPKNSFFILIVHSGRHREKFHAQQCLHRPKLPEHKCNVPLESNAKPWCLVAEISWMVLTVYKAENAILRDSLTKFQTSVFFMNRTSHDPLIHNLQPFRVWPRVRWNIRLLRSFSSCGPQRIIGFCGVLFIICNALSATTAQELLSAAGHCADSGFAQWAAVLS